MAGNPILRGKEDMIRNLGRWWWMAVLLVGASCAVPRMHYYTLEMPHAAAEPGATRSQHIAVQRFLADRVLMDERIIYREGPHEVNFYEYHRWADPPADLATDYVLHRLRDSGAYQRVSTIRDGGQPDFILQGRLYHFEEVDRGKEVFASVALELELVDTKTRASVWRGEAECSRPVPVRDVSGVVREIHGCLEETASKLLAAMQERIARTR
jgi:ABC-type uncharacterized transport system auxiliary subunit